MANITVTYELTLSNTGKDHGKDKSIPASIRRTSPTTLNVTGMSVISASINMAGTTFWSGANNNPYLDIGDYGRVYINTGVTDKSAIPLTAPSSAYALAFLLGVGTSAVSTSVYAYKSTSGNVCTYASNYATFVITAVCMEGYTKSTATVTSSVEAGKTSNVTISNSNIASLYHKVTWSIGSSSHTQTLATGASQAGYVIPVEWLTNMPNDTSASAAVKVETFNSSGTSLGSNSYAFTLMAPEDAVPTISVAVGRYNNTVPQAWNVWVQGKSGIQLAVTASGYQGSTIVNYTISGGAAWTQTGNVFSVNPIYGSGNITYTLKVLDSRGRTATASYTITVLPYSTPTFSSASAYRCNNAGGANENGAYANVSCGGQIASVNGKNTKTLTACYAKSGSEEWSDPVSLTEGEATVIGGNLASDASYQIKFTLSDAFCSVEKMVTVSTAAYTVFFKEGGNAVALGKVSEHDDALEINGDWAIYHGEERLDGTVPITRGGTGATNAADARDALGVVNKAGDTMTGNLYIRGYLYPSMYLMPYYNNTPHRTVFEGSYIGASSFAAWEDSTGNNRRMLEVRTKDYESSLDNAVMVRVCDNGVWGNYRVFHAGMPSGVPVANGGTGATNAATARANLGANNASNLNAGTVPMARMPFKVAYGSGSVAGNSALNIDYSSAGFTSVPCVVVSYSTAGANWSGDNGALKVYGKTTTGATVIVGGSFNTQRQVDWIAIGT